MVSECQEHRFSFASTFANVAEVAEKVSRLCASQPGTEELSDGLRLCLAEALNNVVEHAYRGDQSSQIDVEFKLSGNGYDVTVVDCGVPMPDGTLPAGEIDLENLAIDDLPEGGFGWMLIRNEVDHLDYERDGDRNVLSLGKRVNA